jgi:AraC-like DNA-binding protein
MKNSSELKDDAVHGSRQIPLHIYHQIYKRGGLGVPYHWHKEIELIYVEEGTMELTINATAHQAYKGDFFCINGEELHEIHSINQLPSVHHALVFSPEILSSEYVDECQTQYIYPLLNLSLKLPHKIDLKKLYGAQFFDQYINLMKGYDHKEEGWYLNAKACLLKMLAILAHHHLLISDPQVNRMSKKIEEIKKVISYIHANYTRKLYIAELADIANRNPQYFCRFFKSVTGRTPVEYINQYRISRATRILEDEKCSVTDLCFKVGFENQSYFIKVFKKQTSYSPLDYMKRHS